MAYKPRTKQQLADEYGVTRKTILNWIYINRELYRMMVDDGRWSSPYGKTWTAKQVEILKKHL